MAHLFSKNKTNISSLWEITNFPPRTVTKGSWSSLSQSAITQGEVTSSSEGLKD